MWLLLTDVRLWQLLTGGRLWREETERQPVVWGCHRTHQAGETYRRPGAWRRHRMDRAVGEYWRSKCIPLAPLPLYPHLPGKVRAQA